MPHAACVPVCCAQRPVRPALRILTLTLTLTAPLLSSGVCLTLTSVGPLYSLPLERYRTGRPVSPWAALGAVCAIAGVAVLSLVK